MDFDGIDEAQIRRERQKARELRRSRWWQHRIAAGVCFYCGKATPPAELSMDHVVPLVRGGRSTKGNLVPACKSCNTDKKTSLLQEWPDFMAEDGDSPG
ncbi:MAG: HNH endonuclease [Thermodesulfobacteriota bacterium]